MKNVQKQKRANKSLPFFFRDEFRVSLVIILISVALLITTFTFDIVPPILNRGIDRKSTRLNSSHSQQSRMPSSA